MNGFSRVAMGWGLPTLPKRPVFSFVAASVQPQNR